MKIKILVFFISTIALLIIVALSTDRVMPWDKKEAIETTLNWGGLSILPFNVSNLKVYKKGSLFTREFIIEFNSDELSIESWINSSSRLRETVPINDAHNIVTYNIHPGENGAFGGHVIIDKTLRKVIIDMSWS